MSDAATQPLTVALLAEFAGTFRMFRDGINRLDDQQWGEGAPTWTEVPARIAMHTLLCADFYIAPSREGYNFEPDGVQWWDAPIDKLPTRQEALDWITRTEQATIEYLTANGDTGLLTEKAATAGKGQTKVHWLIYALRHLQNHVSQLSAECKKRGIGAADWG